MLRKEIIQRIEISLPAITGKEGRIGAIKPVGGGSINMAFELMYADCRYFLKVNEAAEHPRMFALEGAGLAALGKVAALKVPQVVMVDATGNEQYLLLEYLEQKSETPDYFYELGKGLATLHRQTARQYGWEEDNYIGSLKQLNTVCDDWNEFFVTRRIEPLLKTAIDTGDLPALAAKAFDKLFKRLPDIFPTEKPALLHGDLWSGNKMNSTHGPCIFDPAVYYGHREMDIAMTRLFGGFTSDFYVGYKDTFPMEKGWEKRMEICNLYPLLVHVHLFGGEYSRDVLAVLKVFN